MGQNYTDFSVIYTDLATLRKNMENVRARAGQRVGPSHTLQSTLWLSRQPNSRVVKTISQFSIDRNF